MIVEMRIKYQNKFLSVCNKSILTLTDRFIFSKIKHHKSSMFLFFPFRNEISILFIEVLKFNYETFVSNR